MRRERERRALSLSIVAHTFRLVEPEPGAYASHSTTSHTRKNWRHQLPRTTTDNFQFTRSDSFVSGKGEDGRNVSILEFDDKTGFAARFNSYRFSVNDNVSTFVKTAYTALCQGVDEATPVECTLTQESAMVINNIRALHCRDVIKDNRRVLVRIFGLSKFSTPIVVSEDPLVLQG